jgi:hypothetical protein
LKTTRTTHHLWFCLLLVLLGSCQVHQEDVSAEYERTEKLVLLKEDLQGPKVFNVHIYTYVATKEDKLGRKAQLRIQTTNDQIYFEGFNLYVYPNEGEMSIDQLIDQRIETLAGVKKIELYFRNR